MEQEQALRMGVQPVCDFGGPVGTNRVQDQMDRLAHGRLLVEQRQQLAEFARAVLEADHATHLAIVDAEASQQVHGAVALVLELAPRRPPRSRWLVWRCRLAYANARLLIDTEQGSVCRRTEQQLR